jgi:hypothetical protein
MTLANTQTTAWRTRKWYRTVNTADTKMTAGRAWTAKMKPRPGPNAFALTSRSASGPNTKAVPWLVKSRNLATAAPRASNPR